MRHNYFAFEAIEHHKIFSVGRIFLGDDGAWPEKI
jgi:hypothetical protein